MIHDFSSNVNKVNKAVAEVRTMGERLPLTFQSSNYASSKFTLQDIAGIKQSAYSARNNRPSIRGISNEHLREIIIIQLLC